MRSLLFLSKDKERCESLAKAIEGIDDYSVLSSSSAQDAVTIVQSGYVDSVFVDLESPISQVEALLTISKERFPEIYLILIRGKEFVQEQRNLLNKGDGSFSRPQSRTELEGLLHRFNRDYPLIIKKVVVHEITIQERVANFLATFHDVTPTQKQLTEGISADQKLTQVLIRRINSPFYGLPTRISTVAPAVRLLGVNGVLHLYEEFIKDDMQVA